MVDGLLECFGLGGEIRPAKYRFTVCAGCGGVFEGVKKIETYSRGEVVLLISGGKLVVKGENLGIKKYGESEIALSGRITGVTLG